MKKVLIITYYWPPMGGGGVQRWLKFTKYLREFGWEPIIYTPSNADIANKDDSLLTEIPDGVEVVKKDIWEPFDLYKRFTGKSKNEKVQPGFLQESDSNRMLQNISVWVRGNLFIPDAKKYWIKPSVKFLVKFINDNNIDAVVSTGPPHSNHLIALSLKKKINIKWLADFRDPWTNIDYYDKLKLTAWADKTHRKLESKVVKEADEVVTVSWSWAEDFKRITGRLPKVVTNGYDPDDFNDSDPVKNEKLTITHIGSLNKDRNPFSFWKALGELIEEGDLEPMDILIRLIGPTDMSVFEEIDKQNLKPLFDHIQHLPHKEVLKHVQSSDVLLLPLNNTPNIDGVIPGKLYEYLASNRPILCIGKPSGDSSRIIEESRSGVTFDFKNVQGIKDYIKSTIDAFKAGELKENQGPPEKYSRKKLAGDIASILTKITE